MLSACSTPPRAPFVTAATLENAPPADVPERARAVIHDAARLRDLCVPLGPRLGLLEIHSRAEWERLRRVAPHLGPCPDLDAGTVVGIACWAGLPLTGTWPIHVESVRVRHGGGLVNAHFEPGSYLPDGTTYLETAYVAGLDSVSLVDVNGTSFYPAGPP